MNKNKPNPDHRDASKREHHIKSSSIQALTKHQPGAGTKPSELPIAESTIQFSRSCLI